VLAEREIQTAFIDDLKKQGYKYLGSHLKVEDLEPYFKKEVERLNSAILPQGLNDAEFKRLMNNVNQDMAIVYGLFRYGVELILDDNRNVTIKLFDTQDYNNNTFQVTEELEVKALHNRRLDVVILINGIPVVASELKKVNGTRGVIEAIDDINVYAKEGIYRVGLLKFVQIYVASNNVATKYFATSIASQAGERYGTGFHWADENNNRIKKLVDPDSALSFTETFLKPEMLCELLWRYMLNIPAPRKEIRILRPYQVFAVKAGIERLLDSENNGYFWHATGSGKTLTSYMLTKAISEMPKFSKTIMLLDRNDLADQTIEEYGLFSSKEVTVAKGKDLLDALNDPTVKTVITTIQSFSRMLEKKARVLHKYSHLPVCFIVDECHRSTFGDMFGQIKKFYSKAQFIGFTGTPRLAENPTVYDKLTKDVFGDPIHVYTIKNAIDDANVLSFEMKEVIIKAVMGELDKKDKNYYRNPARLDEIANYVVSNFWKHTAQKYEEKNPDYVGGYTGMFAAADIPSAYAYWKLMTPLLAKQNRTAAIIFSVQNKENDLTGDGTAREWFEEILLSYDITFGTNFSILLLDGDFEEVRKNYLRDVTKRIKNKEIDLIIVSDMLLTGFDAPTLNTIYLDKNLQYHNLLQAMSRTNRLHTPSSKTVGNIVIFSDREMSEAVNDSIVLYSNGENAEGIIQRRVFNDLYLQTVEQIMELKRVYPNPESIDKIEEVRELVELARLFSSLNGNLQRLQTYDEWEKKDWKKLSTTEEEIQQYYASIVDKKNHFNISGKITEDEQAELAFAITEITTVVIDVAYINDLLRKGVYAPEKDKKKWFNQVKKAVQNSTDPEVKKSEEAILKVANNYKQINSEEDMWKKLDDAKQEIIDVKYKAYSHVFDIDEPVIRTLVMLYQNTGSYPENRIDDILNGKGLRIKEKKVFRKKIEEAIQQIAH
jgi:type I restriction enzyme R subunit